MLFLGTQVNSIDSIAEVYFCPVPVVFGTFYPVSGKMFVVTGDKDSVVRSPYENFGKYTFFQGENLQKLT